MILGNPIRVLSRHWELEGRRRELDGGSSSQLASERVSV